MTTTLNSETRPFELDRVMQGVQPENVQTQAPAVSDVDTAMQHFEPQADEQGPPDDDRPIDAPDDGAPAQMQAPLAANPEIAERNELINGLNYDLVRGREYLTYTALSDIHSTISETVETYQRKCAQLAVGPIEDLRAARGELRGYLDTWTILCRENELEREHARMPEIAAAAGLESEAALAPFAGVEIPPEIEDLLENGSGLQSFATTLAGLEAVALAHPDRVRIEQLLDDRKTASVRFAADEVARIDNLRAFKNELGVTDTIDNAAPAGTPAEKPAKDENDPTKKKDEIANGSGQGGGSIAGVLASGLAAAGKSVATAGGALASLARLPKSAGDKFAANLRDYTSEESKSRRALQNVAKHMSALDRQIGLMQATDFAKDIDAFAQVAKNHQMTPAEMHRRIRAGEDFGIRPPVPGKDEIKLMRSIRGEINAVTKAGARRFSTLLSSRAGDDVLNAERERFKKSFAHMLMKAGEMPINAKLERIKDYAANSFALLLNSLRNLLSRLFKTGDAPAAGPSA